MRVTFLTPEAALLAVGAILPIALLVDGERRARVVRLALGLAQPPVRHRRLLLAALVGVVALVGAAAAQPVLAVESRVESRQDTEVYFVLDTSRSMLASRTLRQPTRFERARRDAEAIRRALPEAPSGLASLTDRLLPHLFPTEDAGVFAAVLERSLGVERPPPSGFFVRATTLGSLTALVNRNYFTREVEHRLAIVLTDAESRPFASSSVGALFRKPPGVRTFFVRYGDLDERIYTLDGGTESGYAPDPRAAGTLRALAGATGGQAFREGQTAAVARAVRRAIGRGETKVEDDDPREVPLAPYAVALAFLPLGVVLWRRNF